MTNITQQTTYQETLDYLYSFLDSERKLPRTPAEFNLPQTTALLQAVGEPHHSFPSIVIAGTKGKGSTAALLEAILRLAGLRTGLWISPHLHSYRERIQVDRRLISQAELIDAVERLRPVIDMFDQRRYGTPTVFQLGFALALRHFAECAVDIAILEVGLGGRYDSANVVTPALSVITSISYDHMRTLGDTLTRIAYEKAGILKSGVAALTIPQHPEAMSEIVRVAAEVGAPLRVAAAGGGAIIGERFDPFAIYQGPTETALQGVFQRENALLAAGAALLLRDAGWRIPDAAIGAGLAGARWPGRMEVVAGAPPIVLDGAHNGDSARKLVVSLNEAFPGRRLAFVLGVSYDKDIPRILPELMPAADALVLTRSRHPRAMTNLDELAAGAAPFLRPSTPLLHTSDVPEALEHARALAGPGGLVCVTGSLFVVAAAREALGIAEEVD